VIAFRAIIIAVAAILSIAPANAAKLKVVASFSILADMASRIGADRVEIRTLVVPTATRTSSNRRPPTPRPSPKPT